MPDTIKNMFYRETMRIRNILSFDTIEIGGGDSIPKWKEWLLRQFKIVAIVISESSDKNIFLRASALTYSTLLSIVPTLAMMFSLAKGFDIQNKIKPIIIEKLSVGNQEIASKIIEYVDNTNAKALGTVGLVILIFSIINVLGNVESAFNDIWGVKKHRGLFRKFSDYLSVLIVGPVLVICAIGVTASLSSNIAVQRLIDYGIFEKTYSFLIILSPYISLWLAFTFIYIFMPNKKVNILSAFYGAIIGGTLWQFSQWGYIHFQIGVSNYNAIYGTFASLPIFLVWVYISWIIVLLGAEISFAHQNADEYLNLKQIEKIKNMAYNSRLKLSVIVLKEICRDFYDGHGKVLIENIAKRLNMPKGIADIITSQLCNMGVLTEISADGKRYILPSRPLDSMKLRDIIKALKGYDNTGEQIDIYIKDSRINSLLDKIKEAENTAIDDVSMKDILLL